MFFERSDEVKGAVSMNTIQREAIVIQCRRILNRPARQRNVTLRKLGWNARKPPEFELMLMLVLAFITFQIEQIEIV